MANLQFSVSGYFWVKVFKFCFHFLYVLELQVTQVGYFLLIREMELNLKQPDNYGLDISEVYGFRFFGVGEQECKLFIVSGNEVFSYYKAT